MRLTFPQYTGIKVLVFFPPSREANVFDSLVPSPFIKRSGYEANLLHTLILEDQLPCIVLNTN